MSLPPKASMRLRARSTTRRRAAAACCLLGLLTACGGRSQDPHSPGDTGAAGASNAAGASGGASNAAGVGGASGGASNAAGMGGASTAGAPSVREGQTMCWLWSALKNQPSPGATGIKACPSFYDLDLVVRENCVYKVVDPSPVPPDATASGDCCYAITEYSCR